MYNYTQVDMPINGNTPLVRGAFTAVTRSKLVTTDSHYMPPDQESQDSNTETSGGIEDHFIFSHLDTTREKIADIEAQIKALKQQISEIKDQVQYTAYAAMAGSPESEGMQLATHLYWIHDDLIRAQTIGNYLGTSGQAVSHRIGKAVLKLRCNDCGETVDYFPTSRSDAKMHRDWGTCVCEACQIERQTGHHRRAEAFRQQIEALRSMPYSEYLKTDHWQGLRIRMLKRAGFKCQVCNGGGQLHVHHRTYKNRGNEDLKDLIVLCANCHQEFHDKMELES